VQLAVLRVFGVVGGIAALAALAAAPAPPVRAEMMDDLLGNSFLMALTNAGVSPAQPETATALGQSVCPMLVAPGGSFDSVAAKLVDADGMTYKAAGVFALVAIATYCPAVLSPLMPHRLAG
jgi:Protein of unknown function (DUF732)